MSAGTIVQVDPATLTIALNVRTDAKVDKEFVASIKTLGILQPPMVTANADGGYDVVHVSSGAIGAEGGSVRESVWWV
ncbi:MAG: hypothetical protein WED09_07355 [Homoserinimonas sp.]